jgi:hypothetical protein
MELAWPGSAPAQDGLQRHGPRPGRRVILLGGALLPAIDRVSPPIGLSRPPRHRGNDRGPNGDNRMFPDLAVLLQPPEPPLDGGDPALPQGRQPEALHQPSGRIHVPGGDGVFQRLLGQTVAQAPGRGAAPQHRDQAGFAAFQPGQQHVTEQMVVAVPLPPPVQRHQQQVRPRQAVQHVGGAVLFEHRFTQRPEPGTELTGEASRPGRSRCPGPAGCGARLLVAGRFRAGDPVQHGEGGGDDPQGGGQPGEHDEVVLGSRRPERVAELRADEQPGGQEPQPG